MRIPGTTRRLRKRLTQSITRCSTTGFESEAGCESFLAEGISEGTQEEVMLIKGNEDLTEFMSMYGIDGKIEKIY